MTRARIVALVLAALLLTGLAACGDDGDDDAGGDETTTTSADAEADDDETATTDADDEGSSTTEAPTDDESTTTEGDATTTSPNLPPNDSPLHELLLDPGAVGEGFAPDDTLGDGSFDADLCEEVTIDESWEDQAAQALLRGTGDDAAIFQQSVLRFPDAGTAEAFVATITDALVSCQPETEIGPLDGIGDEAHLARTGESEAGTATGGIVRVGDLVTWLFGLTGPDVEAPVDEALVGVAADVLAS